MKGLTLIGWLPLEFLPFIIVGAGLLMIVGARTMAVSLLVMAVCMALLPPMIEPFLAVLPLWALLGLGAVVVVISIRDLMSLGRSDSDRDEERRRRRRGRAGGYLFLFAALVFVVYAWFTGQ